MSPRRTLALPVSPDELEPRAPSTDGWPSTSMAMGGADTSAIARDEKMKVVKQDKEKKIEGKSYSRQIREKRMISKNYITVEEERRETEESKTEIETTKNLKRD